MTDQYPWYFKPNRVKNAWKFSKGSKVVIDLVDTCVDFSRAALHGKNYTHIQECNFTAFTYSGYMIHGTAMASVMVANKIRLFSPSYYKVMLTVAGIAPRAKIKNTATGVNRGIGYDVTETAFAEAKKERENYAQKSDAFNMNIFRRPKLILINLSGGSRKGDATEWSALLDRGGKDNHTLFIAAVGNRGRDLNLYPNERIYPGGFKIDDKKPLIRVGGTDEYADEEPTLWKGSNFHRDHVDILAPANRIPVLAPQKDDAEIVSGTSEATAIVTATLALMAKCKLDANATELKESLFQNADKFTTLENYVDSGKVLNVSKAVESFCLNSNKLSGDQNINNDQSPDEL